MRCRMVEVAGLLWFLALRTLVLSVEGCCFVVLWFVVLLSLGAPA
jgi:hypothetical protein